MDINIPTDLKSIGVYEEDFDVLAENALKDICTFTNPKQGEKEDIINILEKASLLEFAKI
jgi:Alcohol dehydrogenase, class IV